MSEILSESSLAPPNQGSGDSKHHPKQIEEYFHYYVLRFDRIAKLISH
jgi:hypothetical protein